VAFAIEDNLTLLNCGGIFLAVEPGLVKVEVGEGNAGLLTFALPRHGTFQYQVYGDDQVDTPYETLEVRFEECLIYLGAFRQRPQKLWRML
jgi:hypothetical protein